jgi:hypothetical protein
MRQFAFFALVLVFSLTIGFAETHGNQKTTPHPYHLLTAVYQQSPPTKNERSAHDGKNTTKKHEKVSR